MALFAAGQGQACALTIFVVDCYTVLDTLQDTAITESFGRVMTNLLAAMTYRQVVLGVPTESYTVFRSSIACIHVQQLRIRQTCT